jgi:hypothetical protein
MAGDGRNATTVLKLPAETRVLIFRELCDPRPAAPTIFTSFREQRLTMIGVLQTCHTFRREAMPIFLHYATFEAHSQRVVESMAGALSRQSLSQIRNLFLSIELAGGPEDGYDVLGNFPNVEQLCIFFGDFFCRFRHSIEGELCLKRGPVLVGYEA